MQSDKSCLIVEQYLAYLITIKGHSKNTVLEYRLDLLQFFKYIAAARGEGHPDFQFVDINFIHSISLGDMYGFLLIAKILFFYLLVQEQEKLFQYGSSGSILKLKYI